MPELRESAAAAMKCLDDFMAAFNARDAEALAKTLNVPMVRLASEKLSIIDQLGPQIRQAIEANLGDDWDHSSWDRR